MRSTAWQSLPGASIRQRAGLCSSREITAVLFLWRGLPGLVPRVKDTDFDYGFHLAAMVGGRLMIENNPLAVADDLSIDAAYWRWAKETCRRRPPVSVPARPIRSSCKAPRTRSFEGGHDLLREQYRHARHELWVGQATCEYLAKWAYTRHGLNSICYRPFSGYGEDQDDAYPFPSICKRVLANRGAEIVEVGNGNSDARLHSHRGLRGWHHGHHR